jgi:hypothetical protein
MPEKSDNFDSHCFMITNPSRNKFYLYGNDPNEIQIGDIANATSKQCRFTGHMLPEYWYSVAEHMCDVARIIKVLGGSKEDQFAGLMHDSPEAYLSDICAPFKREIGTYYDKELLIWKRIAAKFGIPEKLPDIVKEADWLALFIEASTFVVPNNLDVLEGWVGWDTFGQRAMVMREKFFMSGFSYGIARVMYLEKFNQLSSLSAAA